MMEEQPVGCGVALLPLFLCAAIFTIIVLALIGPTIGNVFSNVIMGLEAAP
jgi:hypothetical protein